jgi:hypothetical protein
MARKNRRKPPPAPQASPAPQPHPEQPKQNENREWADWKSVRTSIVTLIIGGILGWAGKAAWDGLKNYNERQGTRAKISQEIQHRIPIAKRHVNSDAGLARKYLDGIDPRLCLHEEYKGIPLRKLLDDWHSAGGAELDQESRQLAANANPTPEQALRLIELLESNPAFTPRQP